MTKGQRPRSLGCQHDRTEPVEEKPIPVMKKVAIMADNGFTERREALFYPQWLEECVQGHTLTLHLFA
jgi:hypothetical protein